jgi:soluble lytic murein transglycosylase
MPRMNGLIFNSVQSNLLSKSCPIIKIVILISICLILVAGLVSGCSGIEEPPVTYVIVTSAPDSQTILDNNAQSAVTEAATQSPTETPQPTATATPQQPPDAALSAAHQLARNGYYERAFDEFAVLVERQDATDDQRAEAAFAQAQAALRAGLFDQAVSALTALINRYPGDYRVGQAHFLRGDAYMGLADWNAAIADFREYLRLRPGVADSYAHERIADAHIALGQNSEAMASYDQATQTQRSLELAMALREKIAQIYLTFGDVDAAVAQYDAILAEAENDAYRAVIELAAAQAQLGKGDLNNALLRMQRIFNDYPDTPQALQAMNMLLENERELDFYQQGRVHYYNGDYQNAIIAFNEFSTTALLADIPAELHLLLGRAYREVGNSPAALVAFQTIPAQYPTDPLFGEALLEQGRTRFQSGDTAGAIQTYLDIAENNPNLQTIAPEALWRAGYLYTTSQQLGEGREVFLRLAENYPNSAQTSDGLLIAAEAAQAAGDTASAEQLYGRLIELVAGDAEAEAAFQLARLQLSRGDTANATTLLDQVIAAAPDSYYAARARDLKSSSAPFVPPANITFTFDDAQQLAQAEDWLRTTFSIPPETSSPLWPMTPELLNDPRIARGTELWQAGAIEAAEAELLDAVEAFEDDALASYRLSLYLRGLGVYYPSQQAAANLISAADVATLEAPPYIARMRFPAYYRDEVLRLSEERGIDPLLMLSLIRHESLFDTNATAAAGEKGLMQVIPSTADYIASELGAGENYDLFRPYVGIEFGAFYLDEQLERFDGNVYAALSGYNAGPGRAINWLEAAGTDPDRFMDTISIDSTQLYVQRIYSFYSIYRTLYGTT